MCVGGDLQRWPDKSPASRRSGLDTLLDSLVAGYPRNDLSRLVSAEPIPAPVERQPPGKLVIEGAAMSEPNQVQERIITAVTWFESQSMALKSEAITVNLSEPYLIVTLRGAICQAERQYAQDRSSRELLEKLYADVFDVAKHGLDAAVGSILGRHVQRSRMSVDPMLGDAILVFVLGPGVDTEKMKPSGKTQPPDNREGMNHDGTP